MHYNNLRDACINILNIKIDRYNLHLPQYSCDFLNKSIVKMRDV